MLQLELLQKRGVQLISYWDPEYPSRLKRIPDAPSLLYFKGKPESLNSPALAIVGTRLPTPYGKLITERFSSQLVASGFCLISGLARGVDTLVHRTVLREGGVTVAVLAGGIDWIYPAENRDLAEQICTLFKKGIRKKRFKDADPMHLTLSLIGMLNEFFIFQLDHPEQTKINADDILSIFLTQIDLRAPDGEDKA